MTAKTLREGGDHIGIPDIAILDSTGTKVVEYQYDAWGKPIGDPWTLTTAYDALARLNPFRYRGYVYDTETGLYYLRSRYYDPVWGRFLNADTLLGNTGSILSHSIFTYCKNAPIIGLDPSGNSAIEALHIGLEGIGRILSVARSEITRIADIFRTSKKINSIVKKEGISQEEVLKAILLPIAETVMQDVKGHAGGWYYGQTILFSYRDGDDYVVYGENSAGMIYKWRYEYRSYSLRQDRELKELFYATDRLLALSEDPASSSYFPDWYSIAGALWSWAKVYKSPELLNVKSCTLLN